MRRKLGTEGAVANAVAGPNRRLSINALFSGFLSIVRLQCPVRPGANTVLATAEPGSRNLSMTAS